MPDAVKDHLGNEVPAPEPERYPKGAPAREGSEPTPPSGQGGAMPKNRPDYQDQWPANPPPSESAAAKGEENYPSGKSSSSKKEKS